MSAHAFPGRTQSRKRFCDWSDLIVGQRPGLNNVEAFSVDWHCIRTVCGISLVRNGKIGFFYMGQIVIQTNFKTANTLPPSAKRLFRGVLICQPINC